MQRKITIFAPDRTADGHSGSTQSFENGVETYGLIARDKEQIFCMVRRAVEVAPGYYIFDSVMAEWALADRALYRVTGAEPAAAFGSKRLSLERVEKPTHPGV